MRLITRSDFDGLACAALLAEIGLIDDYLFVHPKDMQDGKVAVTKNDVLTNVPFVAGCGLWFDHHSSEDERLAKGGPVQFEGSVKAAPSCARVVYDYYGGAAKFKKFDDNGLMRAVDKSDSGDLTDDEIRNPKGWILLSFVMDARTGLGRFKDYRISNHALMKEMIQYCRTMPIERILDLPDVNERVVRYFIQAADYELMLSKNSRLDGNVLVIDLRQEPDVLSGNRFTEYALYPKANVSMRILWGREKKNIVITVGYSILNRTCKVDVGSLMLKNGGGGHRQVGTCQVSEADAPRVIAEILAALKAG